jgi:GTP cyclohydrolase II
MVRIAKSGGALVYLYEEGRGAGLQAKMRAINLQQSLGLSSSEAYARLGLRADVRLDYAFVRSALEDIFGKEEWILLTNNPHKEALVREAGITIIGTESLVCDRGSSTVRAYLEAKRQQFGHRIEE